MGGVAIRDRDELERDLAELLGPKHEVFAFLVATGTSYAEAALSAGFCVDYGKDLMSQPKVRERISQLIADQSGEFAGRTWAIGNLFRISLNALNGTPARCKRNGISEPAQPPNLQLARATIMDIAKLKGYVVEKSARLNAHVSASSKPDEFEILDRLEPGARQRLLEVAERELAALPPLRPRSRK